MKIQVKGLREAQRTLKDIERRVERMGGSRPLPFDEIMTPSFMARFSNFSSFEEMVNKSGFAVNSQEDFEAIPDEQWDHFVAANTQFRTWSDMLELASAEYLKRGLGLEED